MPAGPRLPPPPTPQQAQRAALKARVDNLTVLSEENATLRAELDQLTRANKIRDLWAGIEKITLERGISAGLGQAAVGELVAAVSSAWNKHLETGTRPEAFDVYGVLAARIAGLKGSIAPAHRGTSPTAPLESLPPPAPEGRVVDDTAAQEQARRAAQERGARLAEQVLKDREAYRAALRKYGLEDPSRGSRGNASGTGFGL